MSGFVIYSMGDADFMRLALLGLSHAFEQGAISIAKIGLLLGLLAVFWKGVWSPDKIEFKQFFIGFFLVYILFTPQVEVTLIHNDGASADAMPPIPIGIALTGAIATNFGYSMANSLREFYHTTYLPGSAATGTYRGMLGLDKTDAGGTAVAGNGLEPLRALMKLRYNEPIGTFNSALSDQDIDFTTSLGNYIEDCVLKDEYNSSTNTEVETSKYYTSNFAWDHMKVGYNGWVTSVALDNGQGFKNMGCGDAYTKISQVMDTTLHLNALSGGSFKGEALDEQVKQGQEMLGAVNADAWKIKVNQLIYYHYKKTQAESRWASQAELMASQVEFEAIDKRRASIGVQHSLWSEMAIPLITYIEAFVFLIGPIMPFVIAFGEKGAGLVVKYFFILVWVNTWPVLQVGVNMYLQNAINKASFNTSPYDAFSWAGFNTTFTEVDSFIAMGSTLQTMVPALSLMLLYGSAHTMINVANSAQKGGGSEGAAASPTAAAPAHSGKTSTGNAAISYNTNTGQLEHSNTGAGDVSAGMKNYTTGNVASNTSSTGTQRSTEQMQSAQTAINQSASKISSMLTESADGKSIVQSESSNNSEGVQAAEEWGNALMKTGKFTLGESKALGVAIATGMYGSANAEISAAFKMPLGGKDSNGRAISPFSGGIALKADAGVKVAASSDLKSGLAKLKEISTSGSEGWSQKDSESLQAAYTKSQALGNQVTSGNKASFGQVGLNAETASKAWSTASKQSENESRLQSELGNFSGSNNFNFNAINGDGFNNTSQEDLASGKLPAESVRATALGNMSNQQKQQFSDYKSQNGFGNTLNDDMKALKGFSQTEQGSSLAGMASNFKTTDEFKNDFNSSIGDTSGLSKVDYNQKVGRFADNQFESLMSGAGGQRFETAANYLEQMNKSIGGGAANLQTAANDFRKLDQIADKAFNTPAPKTAEQDGGPTAKSVQDRVEGTQLEQQQHKANKDSLIDNSNIKEVHQANVDNVKNRPASTSPESVKSDALSNQKINSAPLDNNIQPVKDMVEKAANLTGSAAAEVSPVVAKVEEMITGTAQEKAASSISSNGRVSDSAGQLLTSGNKDEAHTKIAEIVGAGLSPDATKQDKYNLMEMLSAGQTAPSTIESLRATGDKEDAKLADTIQQNVNSLENSFNGAPSNSDNKELMRQASSLHANGQASLEQIAGYTGLSGQSWTKANPDSDPSAQMPNQSQSDNRALPMIKEADDLKVGKALEKSLKDNGQENTPLFKQVQDRNTNLSSTLDSNKDLYASSLARSTFASQSNPNTLEAGKIISSSLNGAEPSSFKNDSFDGVLQQKGANSVSSFVGLGGLSKNVNDMASYEQTRPLLKEGLANLESKPEFSEQANRLRGTIAGLDKKMGFDQRESMSLTGTVGYQTSAQQQPVDGKMDARSLDKFNSAKDGQTFSFGGDSKFTKESVGEGESKQSFLRHENGQAMKLATNENGSARLTPFDPSNIENKQTEQSQGNASTSTVGTSTEQTVNSISGVNNPNANASSTVGTPVAGVTQATPAQSRSGGNEDKQTEQGQVNANASTSTVGTSNEQTVNSTSGVNNPNANASSTVGSTLASATQAAPVQPQNGSSEDKQTEQGQESISASDGGNVTRTQSGTNDAVTNDNQKLDGDFITSSFGDGDRINVNPASFENILSADNGTKFEVAGEQFTKINSSDGDLRSANLLHEGSGDKYNIYENQNTGESNLSIEALNKHF